MKVINDHRSEFRCCTGTLHCMSGDLLFENEPVV